MIDVDLIGAPAFSVAVDGDDFVYTGFNRRMAELTGHESADMLGRSPAACLPAAMADAIIARYRRCLDERQAVESEILNRLPSGARWCHATLTPVLDAAGKVSSLVGVCIDITERKAAEREGREAETRMALALDVLDGGLWHLDVATGEMEVTPKLASLVTGRAADRMDWGAFTARMHADDTAARDIGPMLRGDVDAAAADCRVDLESAGGTRWFRVRRRLIRDDAGAPERIVGAVLDVTEAKLLQDVYARQARTDALTGLANRRGFQGSAERFLRAGGCFGLIVLDLDRFKAINDAHGHAAGDAVLRELAARLRRTVRSGDVVARLGGDEFAILVADAAGDALPSLARRLVLAARQPVPTPAGDLTVGISVGAARSAAGDHTIGALAARADRALYDAKMAGRGDWRFAA